jgi:hypothetical protein
MKHVPIHVSIPTYRHLQETMQAINERFPHPTTYAFVTFEHDGTVVARRNPNGIWKQYLPAALQKAGTNSGGANPIALNLRVTPSNYKHWITNPNQPNHTTQPST